MIGFDSIPRYANAAHRVFGSEEILPPGIQLEVDRPEWRYLHGTRWWSSGVLFIAASVGNVGRAQAINPAGSQLLTVVTFAGIVGKTAGGSASITIYPAIIAAGLAPVAILDGRLPLGGAAYPQGSTRTAVANNTAAATGFEVDRFSVAGGADGDSDLLRISGGIVLVPGQALEISDRTVNEGAVFFMYGYERRARPEELVG